MIQPDLQAIAADPLIWGGYLIRPDDQKLTNVEDSPNDSGIYGWYTSQGDLIYIGRATAIRTRLRQHQRSTSFQIGRPTYFSYRVVPECAIMGAEVAHIKALRPVENMFMENGGTVLREPMQAAIEQVWRDALPAQEARLDALYTALAEQIASRL